MSRPYEDVQADADQLQRTVWAAITSMRRRLAELEEWPADYDKRLTAADEIVAAAMRIQRACLRAQMLARESMR